MRTPSAPPSTPSASIHVAPRMSNVIIWLHMRIRAHPLVSLSKMHSASNSPMAPSCNHIWHLGIADYIWTLCFYCFLPLYKMSVFICRCGYDQQVPSINSPAPTDGVLGLGYGKSSIISQLQDLGLTRNVIGHCFSGRGGGYLFFGDSLVPYSSVTWTPMFRSPSL